MLEEKISSASTFMAMGILTSDLIKQQDKTRHEFGRRFDEFSSAKWQKHFTELFYSDAGKANKGSVKQGEENENTGCL